MVHPELAIAISLGVLIQTGLTSVPTLRRRAWDRGSWLVAGLVMLSIGGAAMLPVFGSVSRGQYSQLPEDFAFVLLAVGGAFAFAVVIMASKDWLAVAGPLDLVPRALALWALLWVHGFGGPTTLEAVALGAICAGISLAAALLVGTWTVRRSVAASVWSFAMAAAIAIFVGGQLAATFSKTPTSSADWLAVLLFGSCLATLSIDASNFLDLVPFGSRTQSLGSQLRQAREAADTTSMVWTANRPARRDTHVDRDIFGVVVADSL